MTSICYRPQRSWAKVIFSEACVKNSVHRGRVSGGAGGLQFFGGVSKFFSSFFFQFLFPKKIPSGMHQTPNPPRRSMRGRYASYWNAFLFQLSLCYSSMINSVSATFFESKNKQDKKVGLNNFCSCVFNSCVFPVHVNWNTCSSSVTWFGTNALFSAWLAGFGSARCVLVLIIIHRGRVSESGRRVLGGGSGERGAVS